MESAAHPIEPAPRFAIVGYAARFPGAADADEFWDVLREGRDAVSEVPKDRWDVDEFFDPEPGAPGKVVTRRAGFVDDVTGFDAPFFGMSTREVRMMDPQHRLLLETAWRAVEHSGTAPTALANTNTGVFVGLATHDYLGMASDELTYPEIEAYLAIGTSNAAAAGRISYRLGLQGPAVAVDTACSSSLVAIHQACQALRLGECDLALAGGANVLLSPATMITFSHARMLAPDGRCKTFDAAADGYVRGEGCGVIVIKRLEDAIRDGDRIRAVIRGSAVNQDGASGGLTVPNGVAQQRVIAEALKRAGLAPGDVGYLEAHGTGTSLGDPIEVQAAGAAFGIGRDAEPAAADRLGEDEHRPPGSGRGHRGRDQGHPVARARDAAASTCTSRTRRRTSRGTGLRCRSWRRPRPGSATAGRASRESARSGSPGPTLTSSSKRHPRPRQQPAERPAAVRTRFSVLPLSARTPAALVQVAEQYRELVDRAPGGHPGGRVLHRRGGARAPGAPRRAGGRIRRESAIELLGALADDRPAPGLVRGESHDTPKTAWLFTGQGSQYPAWPASCSTPSRCSPRP